VKRHEQIRRVHVGPLDTITTSPVVQRVATSARVQRLLEPLTRRRATGTTIPEVPDRDRAMQDLRALAQSRPELADLIAAVLRHDWYHSIDLGDGVVTPGFVDHRQQIPHYRLPDDLTGLRCLDIATFDGFWAFELERRGAAEVVAIDLPDKTELDCPRYLLRDPAAYGLTGGLGAGFRLAQERLGSKVQRVETSVYDLDPEIIGQFDLVFLSDVLIHLRDPQLALERAFGVCRGSMVVADVYSPELDALNVPVAQLLAPGETWWYPNVACIQQWLVVAGFEPVVEVNRIRLAARGENEILKVILRGETTRPPGWAQELRDRFARGGAAGPGGAGGTGAELTAD
jgi:tRNA (mo5U34)-methyltransferase